MRKKRKLFDMLDLKDQWDNTPNATWPTLSYTEEGTTVTVIDGTTFWRYMTETFASFKFYDFHALMCAKKDTVYTLADALNGFAAEWTNELAMHPEYARLAQMLNRTDYDPLENYDRKEDGGWKDTTDDDATHSMSYAENKTTTENDPKIKTKTTGSVYGDNSTTAVPDTESITEPVRAAATDKDTITTTNDAHIDTSYVEGDLTVTRLFQDYRVHGNVGVTTAAQMIAGEMDVRIKHNIAVMVLDAFAHRVLTLVEEVSL